MNYFRGTARLLIAPSWTKSAEASLNTAAGCRHDAYETTVRPCCGATQEMLVRLAVLVSVAYSRPYQSRRSLRMRQTLFCQRSARVNSPGALSPQKQNLLYDDGPCSGWKAFLTPRDVACAAFLIHGCFLIGITVAGQFAGYTSVVQTSVSLAALNGLLGVLQLFTDNSIEDERPGMAHEPRIIVLSVAWLFSVVWLCIRLGGLFDYPSSLIPFDPLFCSTCGAAFVWMAIGPCSTAYVYWEELTQLERLRMQGLAACGLVGIVYCFDALTLAVKGPDWWTRVTESWPLQSTCEESTLLFGALALEACMLLHRLGREGVARFRDTAVPLGLASSLGLAIIPTVAQLAWNYDKISLVDFYFI